MVCPTINFQITESQVVDTYMCGLNDSLISIWKIPNSSKSCDTGLDILKDKEVVLPLLKLSLTYKGMRLNNSSLKVISLANNKLRCFIYGSFNTILFDQDDFVDFVVPIIALNKGENLKCGALFDLTIKVNLVNFELEKLAHIQLLDFSNIGIVRDIFILDNEDYTISYSSRGDIVLWNIKSNFYVSKLSLPDQLTYTCSNLKIKSNTSIDSSLFFGTLEGLILHVILRFTATVEEDLSTLLVFSSFAIDYIYDMTIDQAIGDVSDYFESCKLKKKESKGLPISAMTSVSENLILISTVSGLHRFNHSIQTCTTFIQYRAVIHSIIVDSHSNIWLGGIGDCIKIYSATGELQRFICISGSVVYNITPHPYFHFKICKQLNGEYELFSDKASRFRFI